MANYAGAKAAIRDRLVESWTATRLTFQNESPAAPWPPQQPDPDNPDFPQFLPWAHLEIFTIPGGGIQGVGLPGNHASRTDGFIYVHVFVPAGTGDAVATGLAWEIGEIFRSKVFYQAAPGCYVRTWAPRVDEGGAATSASDIEHANTGVWFRVTMSVPFEYWHRG